MDEKLSQVEISEVVYEYVDASMSKMQSQI